MVRVSWIGVLFAVIVRWGVSLHLYSGFNKPPLYGDFEAQRHWMEITYNLPVNEWYKNSTVNDLLYWGLDYPPLTAYHSLICGYIQSMINVSWVELYKSRGIEDENQKLFMRYTVLLADILIYTTAVLFYFFKCLKLHSFDKKEDLLFGALLMLLYPGLMLIDHGHFQYNCISLGLFLWSVNMMCCDKMLSSAILFVLSINYKQMELYHALVFFQFMLGNIIFSSNYSCWQRLRQLIKLGAVVIGTFLFCWLPFCRSLESIEQVLIRLFPFNRGLFEDKVSNIWCTLSLIVKLKQMFTIQQLVNISLLSTLLSSLPSLISVFFRPSMRQFKLSLLNVSLLFFLFSYQVHEKTILICAISSLLIYKDYPNEVTWFLIVSTFSMLPLFVKDELLISSISCTLMFYLLSNLKSSFNTVISSNLDKQGDCTCVKIVNLKSKIYNVLMSLSLVSMGMLTFIVLTFHPPHHLPDLFTVWVTSFSCFHFVLFSIYFNCQQLVKSTDNDIKFKKS